MYIIMDLLFMKISNHVRLTCFFLFQAVASEGGTDDAKRRGDAFARAFSAHLAR